MHARPVGRRDTTAVPHGRRDRHRARVVDPELDCDLRQRNGRGRCVRNLEVILCNVRSAGVFRCLQLQVRGRGAAGAERAPHRLDIFGRARVAVCPLTAERNQSHSDRSGSSTHEAS